MDKHQGHRQRLRERFERTGFEGFAEHEAIELLLTLCLPRQDVKPPAKALLSRFGSLKGVLDAPPDELRQVAGIGRVAPVALRVIREAASLYLLQTVEGRDILNSTDKIEALFRSRLSGLNREVFEAAYLDKAFRLLKNGIERIEVGTVDRAAVYPRKVMEAALRRGASAIILAHNHPAGQLEASKRDQVLTTALIQAGAPLGIRVLDHLIIAGNQVFSCRRQGLLPKLNEDSETG